MNVWNYVGTQLANPCQHWRNVVDTVLSAAILVALFFSALTLVGIWAWHKSRK